MKNPLNKLVSRLHKAESIKNFYMQRKSHNDICTKHFSGLTNKQCSLVTRFWGFSRTRLVREKQNESVLLEEQFDFLDYITEHKQPS